MAGNRNYTGDRKFPLELSLSTLVYGRDRDLDNSKNIYSSFVYVGYTISSIRTKS